LSGSAGAWGEHDDGDAGEADGGAGEVVAVGSEPVGDDAPGEGAGDEDAAVGGEDAPEMWVLLEGGDEPVGGEGGDTGGDPGDASVFTDALPDEPGAADLGDGSESEQDQGAGDRHCGEAIGRPGRECCPEIGC
jgi:hypothetical protein